MWIFSKYGFYSVTVSKQDPSKMQIRARARQDLERLVEFADQQYSKSRIKHRLGNIIETPNADYRYRLICDRESWYSLAVLLTTDIDYNNFKAQIKDPARHRLYAQVWQTMMNLQYKDEANRLQQRFGLEDLLDDDPITEEDLPGFWDDDDDPTDPFFSRDTWSGGA